MKTYKEITEALQLLESQERLSQEDLDFIDANAGRRPGSAGIVDGQEDRSITILFASEAVLRVTRKEDSDLVIAEYRKRSKIKTEIVLMPSEVRHVK